MSVQTYCNRTRAIHLFNNGVWNEQMHHARNKSTKIASFDTYDEALAEFNARVKRIAHHITEQDIRQ